MSSTPHTQHIETIVIGGGQAGLAVVIVDAHERIGDAWRKRWDSLRLFSPSRFNHLDGMPFPGPGFAFITKDDMADYQRPRVPEFASELAPSITQLHSMDYRNPSQLQAGPVLVVGLGNSGAEIALELSRTHRTYVSGRDTGAIPF